MKRPRHPLITTLLIVAITVGIFSYLFHPDVGTIKLIINNHPVDNSFIRFAAIPSSIIALLLIGILAFLLMMGMGFMLFLLPYSFRCWACS